MSSINSFAYAPHPWRSDPNVSDYVVDLRRLQHVDPEAARIGFWIKSPSGGGVNPGGHRFFLRGDEFESGAAVAFQYGVGEVYERLLDRMQPAPWALGTAGSKPIDWNLNPAVRRALLVDLTQPADPSRSTLHGGFTLHSMPGARGDATLALFAPLASARQKLDWNALKIEIIDSTGMPVNCVKAVRRGKDPIGGSDIPRVLVTVDATKFGSPSYLKYSVPVELSDKQVLLGDPVSLGKLKSLSPALRRWTQPSAMVQASHPEIAEAARALRREASSVQDLVKRTLEFMTSVRAKGQLAEGFPDLDALGFLRSGYGSCTSNSHLFAALMRANDVPTRVVTCAMRGAGQDMHWRNEYWVPGRGWVHVEPQGLDIQSSRMDIVETGHVAPEVDRVIDTGKQYFNVMFAGQVDDSGQPVSEQAAAVMASPGLFTREKNSLVPPGTLTNYAAS
jgi:hypothetical protein